ncbi:MarR family transcriptional regulator [Clostridium fermenticellae]|uniref:MarR family transcriptional regulator n=1 Tax=Clostridium fermenticellae TaxID=2068654 RepID=A0A386H4W3_9CLOT|nr:MarR family transcriptional regulator [Clostridium fermenticellae]AYD40791.1 MarR family transcriptional regulator [Clostridium fermenticellae]
MDDKDDKYVGLLTKSWNKMFKIGNYTTLPDQFEELKELTPREIGIIAIVYDKPDIILREICDFLSVPKSSMTSMIDRLEKRDYIKRIISNRDRRSYGVELTEKGRKVQNQHEQYKRMIFEKIIDSLDSNEEQEEFVRLVDKITANIKL